MDQFSKYPYDDFYIALMGSWVSGRIAFMEDNGQDAARHYLECLKLGHKLKYKMGQMLGLEGCAGALYLLGRYAEAVACLAAVDVFRNACGAPAFPGDLPFLKRVREGSLEQLGEAGFMHAWEEGGKISFDQAVENGLSLLSEK